MKKVLVLYYSQSGQLERVMDRVVEPLQASDDVQCDYREIKPVKPYPYPWSLYTFFNVFPEAVALDGCEVEPVDVEGEYDLVILGYTAWFLSPSTPVTGFLKSDQGRKLLAGKPVVTVIACRNMWLMAQEKMKKLLADIGARLIDNVVLTDQGDALYTFVTTPRWMLTGKKEGFWFFPPAGISEEEIVAATRFGDRLCDALKNNEEQGERAMLRGLGAVNVNGKLIASEKIGNRSFTIWSKLLKKAGAPNSLGRNVVMTLYIIFLLILIVTV
ncbi:MAG: dialkylresorcinol condensing enzyme, partial [Sulfurimonadaceae bacterium]|nr:dialkylresorcinol condensing enzyme [Sulfurimonadaceae bacterium]